MESSRLTEITSEDSFNYQNIEELYLLNSHAILIIKNRYKAKYQEIKSALLDYILALEAIYQN